MKKTYLIPIVVILILGIILLTRKCSSENKAISDHAESAQAAADSNLILEPAVAIPDTIISPEIESDVIAKKAPKAPDPQLRLRSIEALESYLASIKPKPQVFMVSGIDTSRVVGEQGSIIFIIPSSLETIDGLPVGESIRVELLEVFSKSEMIKNGVSTMSGDRILISDGMFKVEMSSGGKPLRIKENSILNVAIPKQTDLYMDLFKGEVDSTGSPNWVPFGVLSKYKYSVIAEPLYDDDKVIVYPSTSQADNNSYKWYQEQIDTENKFRNFAIPYLGWWNLDQFLKGNTGQSFLNVICNKDSVEVFELYLIFKDLNIVSSERIRYFPFNKTFSRMPANLNLKLLAIGFYDTIPFIAEKDIFIEQEYTYTPEFIRSTKSEITDRIEKVISIRTNNRSY